MMQLKTVLYAVFIEGPAYLNRSLDLLCGS